MNNYVIIDADKLKLRIEELEKEYILLSNKSDRSLSDIEEEREIVGEQKALARILSQSTPLIPIIKNAFYNGGDMKEKEEFDFYISNLKLDI